MKVKLKSNWREIDDHKHRLTDGKIYTVIGIESDDYRLLNDRNEPIIYPSEIFDIVDSIEPKEWVTYYGSENQRFSYPEEIGGVGFFEDYHDGDEKTIKIFNECIKKMDIEV